MSASDITRGTNNITTHPVACCKNIFFIFIFYLYFLQALYKNIKDTLFTSSNNEELELDNHEIHKVHTLFAVENSLELAIRHISCFETAWQFIPRYCSIIGNTFFHIICFRLL